MKSGTNNQSGDSANTGKRISRRDVLTRAVAFSAALGAPVPFARNLPIGVMPVALAQTAIDNYDKPGLRVLSERPLNMETPAHLLDDDVTPANRLFVRNNGIPPVINADIIEAWTLTIEGLVDRPLQLSLHELKSQFENVDFQLQLECGGNGRAFFAPGVSGNQWTFGAIGCPVWTGVRLRDVLLRAGVKEDAVYTAHYGFDTHLSGDPDKEPISRGIPIEKAMEPHTLLAWAINGEDMPVQNGHPLRIIAPGWPGSCSQKWLTRIALRVPAYPVAPGAQVPEEDMVIIEAMPVKSLITYPETGVRRAMGAAFEVRGSAWSGENEIERVEISIDFGAHWQDAEIALRANKYAWRRWRALISPPEIGYYEIWARATDASGAMQPPVTPGWNPRGYLNNMQHRIAFYAV